MIDKPERTWIDWPQPNATGLAFSCQARPPALRTEYVRSDLAAERIHALETSVNTLEEEIAMMSSILCAHNTRVKALEEALKPFAYAAIRYELHEDDDKDTAWDSDFTVGDLRRAAATVKGETK